MCIVSLSEMMVCRPTMCSRTLSGIAVCIVTLHRVEAVLISVQAAHLGCNTKSTSCTLRLSH